jgi:hypothetical protein
MFANSLDLGCIYSFFVSESGLSYANRFSFVVPTRIFIKVLEPNVKGIALAHLDEIGHIDVHFLI